MASWNRRFDQGPAVLYVEHERHLDEHIDRSFLITSAEQRKHLHAPVANHLFAEERVTELRGRKRGGRFGSVT